MYVWKSVLLAKVAMNRGGAQETRPRLVQGI